MEKTELLLPEGFIWETPAMEEFKVLSRFHGEAASGDPGPSFDTPCGDTPTEGDWE